MISVSRNQQDSSQNKPDVGWVVVDPLHVLLRPESEPVVVINHQPVFQPARIYTITATVADSAGSSTSNSVNVRVVHPPEDDE